MKRFEGWIIPTILLLAFGLRLVELNTRPVWYDESFTVFLAEQDIGAIASGTAADTMPPLYYVLLHFWMPLVGATPFALRMLSVVLSLLIVAFVSSIGTRGFGARTGCYAGLFAALAPFQLYHAQELRMYALFALGALVYLYGVLQLIDVKPRSSTRHPILFVTIGAALALYAHNLAFATLLAANVYLALQRRWRVLARLLAGQVIAALLFVPWLFYVPTQIAKIQRAFWTQPPGVADVLQMLVVFTTYLPMPGVALAGALFVSLAVVVIAGLELVRWQRRGAAPLVGLLLAFLLVPPALLFVLSYLMRPVFVPRGVIASSLAFYVLLAALASRAPRAGRFTAVGISFLIALTTLPFFYSGWGEWRRAPFAAADEFLRVQLRPGDVILHDNKLSFFSMRYYDRALPQAFVADPPGSANDTLARGSLDALQIYPTSLQDATAGKSRVWFVIFQRALDEATEENHPHGNYAWIESRFKQVSLARFEDLNVYLFQK